MKFQSIYTRKQLRDQFQFEDATLNNGIFHPPGTLSVFIFITENKTADRIQYINHLDGDILLMQGQTEGRTDHLLNNQTTNNFEILLFHRTDRNEHPDYGFRYEGKFQYIRHYGQRPTSFILQRHTGRQFKYGDKPTWRLALEAIQELGGRATAKEVTNYIQEKIPEYKSNNTGPDLRLISVNEYGRSAWASNRTPRRTDASNPIDALYRSNINGEPVYELYDPGKHGVWELIADHNGVMRPILSEISQVQKELEENYAFDASNEEDARKKRLISIALRQGQPKFRRALLDAYSSQCAVTKCKIPAILEAAHIKPYRGEHTNHITNGLLLRTDIHTLFDFGMLRIDPVTLNIEVAIQARTTYNDYHGQQLCVPDNPEYRPDAEALRQHYTACTAFFEA